MTATRHHAELTRLVIRQISELLIARTYRWWSIAPRDRLDGTVFGAVLSAGVAHCPYYDPATGCWVGIDHAGLRRRPVNGTAIAQSMNLPHTTVRRRAAALVDSGLLEHKATGFGIVPQFFSGDRLARVMAADAED